MGIHRSVQSRSCLSNEEVWLQIGTVASITSHNQANSVKTTTLGLAAISVDIVAADGHRLARDAEAEYKYVNRQRCYAAGGLVKALKRQPGYVGVYSAHYAGGAFSTDDYNE